MLRVLLFALLPPIATLVGGVVASIRPLTPATRSGLQHFAAGVVFAVAANELLPDVMRRLQPRGLAVSFSLGVLVMLVLRQTTKRLKSGAGTTRTVPLPLLATVSTDVLIDGLLLGIGFAAAATFGRLLAFGMALEALSLGSALVLSLQAGLSRPRSILGVGGVGLLFIIGALLGARALRGVSVHTVALILSFGLAALLFLVTEELLTEAHEVPERPLTTAMFFAGFLVFLVLGKVS